MPPSAGDWRLQAQQIAPLMRLLSDESRLTLVLLLTEGSLTVKQMQDRTGFTQPAVSHHMAQLLTHGLVSVTPRGRSNVYELCCSDLLTPITELARTLSSPTPP